ncbi:glycoside hydrolase family protein [Cupriavidus agavae]|uniref:Glycosyl hydrolase family 32 N-terminal domain-containing protein n=1 Tax=Cupriavidus agavae TaxID=1001822 RepID=A0A4Q7S5H9_9BURK|nr:hypothetical protein [Cupriavidus agavae]RZT41543.1 hypothetical protein EV147_0537 [Cupriavidus agavae]
MRWNKLGIVWKPDGQMDWAKTHAMGPTPFRLNDEVIRLFVTCLDEQGRGRPGYVDVSASDPTRVLGYSKQAVLDIGTPGTFDDNGLMVTSVIEPEPGTLYMYYAGFEICTKIRYRILTGLAISTDGGETFKRYSKTPILDRSDGELYIRGGPFALYEKGVFRLWYVAGSEWTELNGKAMPVYDLRYQTSPDGVTWNSEGTLSMDISQDDEHGFGRPWVVSRADGRHQMFYSVRRRSYAAYRLGYAESDDGVNWTRMDDQMGLDVSETGFDSEAIMYSAVIAVGDRTFCFYNGNSFGLDGIAVAELAA